MTDFQLNPLLSTDSRVTIGRYSYGSPTLLMWSETERIEIGSFCSIADNVTILGGGEHRTDWVTTYPVRIAFGLPGAMLDGHPATKGSTIIGNDVWVGHGATILSGVKVGDGAVIGAHSIVAKDIPPYAVVAGNPAEILKFRFDSETVRALLQIRWWNWDVERIVSNVGMLCSNDSKAFIEFAESFRGSSDET